MNSSATLCAAVWVVVMCMTTCARDQGVQHIPPQVQQPASAKVDTEPHGEEMRRLARDPDLAVVLAKIRRIDHMKAGFLRPEKYTVWFDVQKVSWAGPRYRYNFRPKLEKGFTGLYSAHNPQLEVSHKDYGTKTIPITRYTVGRTYWFALFKTMKSGAYIVAVEEVPAEGAQSQPSKDR